MNLPVKAYWDLLVDYLHPQWTSAALLATLLLGGIGLQLLGPQIMRQFIDAATTGAASATLAYLALLFVGLALAQQATHVGASYLGQSVGWTATNRLRADLLRHCLSLDMAFHTEHTPGEMIERIDGDVNALADFFSQFLFQVLGSALLIVGVLAMIFREDWRVGGALTLFVAGALAVLNRSRDLAVPAVQAERQASADLFGFLEERLAGLDDLRANGGGAHGMRRFHAVNHTLFQRWSKAQVIASLVWVVTLAVFGLGFVLEFGLGVGLFQAGAITLGTVYLFFQYTELLRQPIERLTTQFRELQRAGASIGRIDRLRRTRPGIVDGDGAPIPPGPLAVEFDGVSFRYSAGADASPTVERLSFRLEPGRMLALLGRTGSGKTTLVRLLLRLYAPTTGTIRLNEIDVHQTRLSDLRRRVAMVPQDVQIFGATLRDNVTLFDAGVPDERIRAVLADLGLDDWLRSLPRGLDTELQSGGAGLSAGEAQLLALARVFLRDPGLVILDEPSSRLDPLTERQIEHAIDRLLRGRTAIVIAHRLTTVRRADDVLVVEDGRIREFGERGHLERDPDSHFATLLRAGRIDLDEAPNVEVIA